MEDVDYGDREEPIITGWENMNPDEPNREEQTEASPEKLSLAEKVARLREICGDEEPEPLTPEEKEELLSPEALAELSTEEYLALWRSLNPFYTSHVTRQGIRDHGSMVYHSAGKGDFQSGFTEALKAGKKLLPPSKIHYGLGKEFSEDDVRGAISGTIEDQSEVIDKMIEAGLRAEEIAQVVIRRSQFNSTLADAEPWSDMRAIHFARETCLDELYGGEKGNEIFFIFPTDMIASQYRFGNIRKTKGLGAANVRSERKRNDFFVWSEECEIPIDGGFVFLPKTTLVSQETGSIYETREVVGPDGETVREPFIDDEILDAYMKAVKILEQEGFFDKNGYIPYDVVEDPERRGQFIERLKNEFGLPEEFLQLIEDGDYRVLSNSRKFLDDPALAHRAKSEGIDPDGLNGDEKLRELIRQSLKRRSLGYKKAVNPIPAEEFWKRYFDQHPEQRPKHVVFYDGDPSEAVAKLLRREGIARRSYMMLDDTLSDDLPNVTGPGDTSDEDGPLLGFDSHYLGDPRHDPTLSQEHARFNEIAIRIATGIIQKRIA